MERKHRRSSDRVKKSVQALSLKPASGRVPVIDMRNQSDVSTLACVEISKSIMSRPEVNLASLFTAIAASRNEVNKSDAVLVITAAVLETLGSKRSAEKLLAKSGTVSSFYEKMNLKDDLMRDSLVVLLFALSPEFVKMIESSVKISVERVQSMTDAPHAATKMLEATGELLRSNSITVAEHRTIMDDFSKGRDIPDLKATFVKASDLEDIQEDVVFSDSISQRGLSQEQAGKADVEMKDILGFLKTSNASDRSRFSGAFPNARSPIEVSSMPKRQGLGYKAASAVSDKTATESNFSTVMNTLLKPSLRHARPTIRKGLLEESGFRKRDAKLEPLDLSNLEARFGDVDIKWDDAEVTMEDVKEEVSKTRADMNARSFAPTAMTDEEEAEYLLSLL